MPDILNARKSLKNSLKIDFVYLLKNIKKGAKMPLNFNNKINYYGVSNAAFAVENVPCIIAFGRYVANAPLS